MSIFHSIGKVFGKMSSGTRKSAVLNRLRAVIKAEGQAAEREYLALGRYYYNNLRDAGNELTEAHCLELDAIEARLSAALKSLEDAYGAQASLLEEEQEEVDLEDVVELDAAPEEEEPGAFAKVKDAAVEKFEEAKEAGKKILDDPQGAAAKVKDAAVEKFEEAKEAGKKILDDPQGAAAKVKDAAVEKFEEAKEAGKKILDDPQGAAAKVKDAAVEKFEEAKEAGKKLLDGAMAGPEEEKGKQAGESAQEKLERAEEAVEEKLEEAGEAIEEKAEEVKEAAQEKAEQIKESTGALYEKIIPPQKPAKPAEPDENDGLPFEG